MKYLFISIIIMIGLIFGLGSCQNSNHNHDEEDAHVHSSSDLEPISNIVRSDKTELFVEFPPLVVGEKSKFITHLTNLTNHKAIDDCMVIVRLWDANKKIAEGGSRALKPGIYIPEFIPEKHGIFRLEFSLKSNNLSDTLSIQNVQVYTDIETAELENEVKVNTDEISFTKEQAWKIEFAAKAVSRESIFDIIHTSGEILSAKGENKIVSTKNRGTILYKSPNLQEGREVRSGEILFNLNSAGLLDSNLEERYQVAKAKLERTKSDYDRSQILVDQKIIGKNEFERRKMEYEISKAEFQTINQGFTKGGKMIKASMSGILKNIYVSDGQYVGEGTALVEISSSRKLILEADVSQQYFSKITAIKSAKFKTPYHDEVQSIEDYNGKLVSYGKMMDEEGFIPILFELDNKGALLPGSFVEIFVQTNQIDDVLVVPNSAIMQDYNAQYVYVQTGGESFEKRELELGITDGERTQVLSGINEGEWIVTEGAYQIKIASMSSTIPSHGHSH